MLKYTLQILTVSLIACLYPLHGFAEKFEEPFWEDWSGLWIAEGADYPQFTHFNCCDSYLLIRGGFLIGAENWAGRRWGQAWGGLVIDGYKANYDDGHCVIELEMTDQHTIIASDNMNCGGMNVRFQGLYTRHRKNKGIGKL